MFPENELTNKLHKPKKKAWNGEGLSVKLKQYLRLVIVVIRERAPLQLENDYCLFHSLLSTIATYLPLLLYMYIDYKSLE